MGPTSSSTIIIRIVINHHHPSTILVRVSTGREIICRGSHGQTGTKFQHEPNVAVISVTSYLCNVIQLNSGRTKRLKQCTTSYKDTMAVALDPHPRYRVFL
jgi:hypothetical protein